MGGFSIYHWIIILGIILIPAAIGALIVVALRSRKK